MAGAVDRPPVMWTVGQIAERDQISKQAVSKTVARLVAEHDLPVERDTRGRIAQVSLAHYDHHRGFFGDPGKVHAQRHAASASEEPSDADDDNESFDEAKRQGEWLKVTRQKLQHAEEMKQLVRIDRLMEALVQVGRRIQSVVGQLPNKADDIAIAISKEGTSGVRLALREAAVDLNTRIADMLAEVAASAPEADAALEDVEE